MGLFSALGSLIGGSKAKKASRKAEAAQLEYLNRAITEQQRQFDVTRDDYAPLTALLAPSAGQLGDAVGLNGTDKQQAFMDMVQSSPILAATIRNGENAILSNASATGGLRGGDIQRGLADFRGDSFLNELSAQMSRLAGTAGLGSGATDSISAFGAQRANNVSDLLAQQGATRAGGILTRGGISSNMWNSAGSFADDLISSMFGGGGSAKGSSKIFNAFGG